jgi:hypothetical protein
MRSDLAGLDAGGHLTFSVSDGSLARDPSRLAARKPLSVYTLADPRTGQVRYVGATSDVAARFKVHQSGKGGNQCPRDAWIAELRTLGLAPICAVQEAGPETGYADERKWIAFYLAAGTDLTNVRDTPAEQPKSTKQSARYQREILDAVGRLTEGHEREVTPLEVAEATRIPLTSTRYHIRKLIADGQLVSLFGGRGLRLPGVRP